MILFLSIFVIYCSYFSNFFKFLFKFFKLKNILLMIEKYFSFSFFQKILTKVDENTLIEESEI